MNSYAKFQTRSFTEFLATAKKTEGGWKQSPLQCACLDCRCLLLDYLAVVATSTSATAHSLVIKLCIIVRLCTGSLNRESVFRGFTDKESVIRGITREYAKARNSSVISRSHRKLSWLRGTTAVISRTHWSLWVREVTKNSTDFLVTPRTHEFRELTVTLIQDVHEGSVSDIGEYSVGFRIA